MKLLDLFLFGLQGEAMGLVFSVLTLQITVQVGQLFLLAHQLLLQTPLLMLELLYLCFMALDVGLSLLTALLPEVHQRLARLLVLFLQRPKLFVTIAHGLLEMGFSGEQSLPVTFQLFDARGKAALLLASFHAFL